MIGSGSLGITILGNLTMEIAYNGLTNQSG